jgi:hypothetical protein
VVTLTASHNDAPFRFETSYDTRDTRRNLNASRQARRGTYDRLLVIVGLMGIACLFWRYTIALGAVTLGLTTFVWAMRKRSEAHWKQYEHIEEPPQIVHLTVTDSGYSLKGDEFFAETKWPNVFNAIETNGFLLVQSWRGPRVHMPIDQLRQAGVYERIRAIVDARSPMKKRP